MKWSGARRSTIRVSNLLYRLPKYVSREAPEATFLPLSLASCNFIVYSVLCFILPNL